MSESAYSIEWFMRNVWDETRLPGPAYEQWLRNKAEEQAATIERLTERYKEYPTALAIVSARIIPARIAALTPQTFVANFVSPTQR